MPTNTLLSGWQLEIGHSLQSGNLKYFLNMQSDGNLVLYRESDKKSIWCSDWADKDHRTFNQGGQTVSMGSDGNLVMYKSGDRTDFRNVVWQTHTDGNDGAYLRLEDDGALILYDKGGVKPIWSPSILRSCQEFPSPSTLMSPDGNYELNFSDGKLEVRRTSDQLVMWSAKTWDQGGQFMYMQKDGNFVMYKSREDARNESNPCWASGTAATGSYLKMENDGAFVIYDSSAQNVVWANNTSDWMSAVSSDTPVSQLSIPGTHDSVALYDPVVQNTYFSQCQKHGLKQQLEMGVRALDIRLVLKGDVLEAWHGIAYQHTNFDEIFATCRDFLSTHAGETLFMSIKQESEGNGYIDAKVNKLIDDNSSYWYTDTWFPETLKNVRGRIVLLNRFDNTYGINIGGMSFNDVSDLYGGDVHVQDVSEPENFNGQKHASRDIARTTKWTEVQNCLQKSSTDTNKGHYYINYTSGVIFLLDFAPNTDLVAEYINPLVREYVLNVNNNTKTGILMMDFATHNLTVPVIGRNFRI